MVAMIHHGGAYFVTAEDLLCSLLAQLWTPSIHGCTRGGAWQKFARPLLIFWSSADPLFIFLPAGSVLTVMNEQVAAPRFQKMPV